MEIEQLAKDYHEICREMVEKQIGMITKPTKPYIEWDELTEDMKKGRMFIAEKLLEKFNMFEKDLNESSTGFMEFYLSGDRSNWDHYSFGALGNPIEISNEKKELFKKLDEIKSNILDKVKFSLTTNKSIAQLKSLTQILIDLDL